MSKIRFSLHTPVFDADTSFTKFSNSQQGVTCPGKMSPLAVSSELSRFL